jgi:hypothetical protein
MVGGRPRPPLFASCCESYITLTPGVSIARKRPSTSSTGPTVLCALTKTRLRIPLCTLAFGDLASTCALEYTRLDRTKCTRNPNISAVDLRAPAGFTEIFNLLKAHRMCRLFARLSRTCRLKRSAKLRQMQRRNSNFERSVASWQLLTESCTWLCTDRRGECT